LIIEDADPKGADSLHKGESFINQRDEEKRKSQIQRICAWVPHDVVTKIGRNHPGKTSSPNDQ
jgi:hypothetical protein